MKSRNRKSMTRNLGLGALVLAGLALVLAYKGIPRVWARTGSEGKPVLINEVIDESKLVRLRGNTRPEANAKNDRGRVADDFPMEHMFLQLKRAPELEQALDHYMDEQQDKNSPHFRHWLMPAELGEKYGLADSDIEAIEAWLESYGFTVGYVYPTRMVIDFSGTAGEIREAFHTEIHYLDVQGERHFANMSDPQIPDALAPAVAGMVSMHNFKPRNTAMRRTSYTLGGGDYVMVPADFQTIYNLSPVYRAGFYGQGQTIVVLEDTNSYGTDFATFQSTFGLNKFGGSLTTVHPDTNGNCTNPGTNGDDGEADLDVEMVAAIAPGATVELALVHRHHYLRRADRPPEPGRRRRRNPTRGHQHELWGMRGDQWRSRQRGLQHCISNGRGRWRLGLRLRRRRGRGFLLTRCHILDPRYRRHRLG